MSYPRYIIENRKKLRGKVLDLGCGDKKLPKSIGMDYNDTLKLDIQHNLLKFPYPIKSESFNHIFLNSVIEHIDRYDYCDLFKELKRILKKKGSIHIHVPYFRHASGLANLEHITYLGHGSLNNITDLYIKSEFRVIGDSYKILRILKTPVEAFLNFFPGATHGLFSRIIPVYAMHYEIRKKPFKNAIKGIVSYQLSHPPHKFKNI